MLDAILGNLPVFLLAVGLILIALEAVSPGAHLIVIGVALAGAGFIGMVYPPASDILALAILTLVIGVAAAWVYRDLDFYGGKGSSRTSDSDSLSGSRGYVTRTVTPREGEVKLDSGGFDPHYSAQSTEGTIEEGEEVVVLDPGGGNVLTVEPLADTADTESDEAE